jgi:NADH:ubiquinone reductase (H+-translocating)
MDVKKKVVILGAGYAGVHAAKLLNKFNKKSDSLEITIISKEPYHTLMTELHEVAGGRVEPESVQVQLKKIFGAFNINIITDEIKNIDFNKGILYSENKKYEYDYLMLGSGSEPAFFGIPGIEDNSFTLWSLKDALTIREHIENLFKLASTEQNIDKRKEMLTFVVAGAGFTGIEMMGELVEWKKKLSRQYSINEKEVRLAVIEALPKILPILNDNLIVKADRYLRKKNVELIVNAPISRATERGVELKDGQLIPTKTLIWTCGVQGSKFAANLGLTLGNRGRIQTNEYMQSVDYKNVYVIGDNAYYETAPKKAIPQIVETALQSAETAVHNIVSNTQNKSMKSFKPNYHGLMVSIGSRYAVADIMGVTLSGFMAMALKHLVNLHYLFGVAGFNLVWSYIVHEFFDVKEKRSILGGHLSAKSHSFWLAIFRVYVGVLWLIEGLNKVRDGWLNPDNIFIVQVAGVTGASEQTGEAAKAAVQTIPLLSQPPAIYKWFMDTFVAPNAFFFQAAVVLTEIAIGLALIAGLFTFIAAVASVFMSLNFILSAMAGAEILWFIFGAFALCSGAGRAFGLDYYVQPWLKNFWNKTYFARKTYLYID